MKHKLTYTENYLLVVDDSEIKVGDLILYKNSSIAKCLGFPTDGGGGLKIQIQGDIAKIKTDFESCKKIIAHLPLNNSPVLEGVPLLPPLEVEDDVEMEYYMELEQRREIAKNFKGQVAGRHPDMFGGNEIHHMVRGYLEAKEKYKYTEEDMRKMFEAAIGLSSFSDTDDNKFQYALQSLSQPKIPIGFEYIDTITTDEGNYPEWVGEYIYEGGEL